MAIELMDQYIVEVEANPNDYCKWVKLAVKRHQSDLKRDDLFFDREEANKGLKFIKLLRHTGGKIKGKKFHLLPFQAFCAGSLFGWKTLDNSRRFRTAYKKIARKNAKTELGAAISLYLWWQDRKTAPQIHCAATKKDQAAIAFDAIHSMAKGLARDSKKFKNATIIMDSKYNKKIYLKEGGFIQTLGRDSKKEDGFFPSVAFIDEYHAHPTNQMIDILESGFGTREEPMTLIITTAGVNRNFPCYKFETNVCQKVLEGIVIDDSLFCIMFDLDDGDDWEDQKNWSKANPLGVTIPAMLKTLQIQAKKAALYGAEKLNAFLTKNLNRWTSSHSAWFPDEKWMANCEAYDTKKLLGRKCFGGLDLASTRDINAWILFFPLRNKREKHIILCRFFIAEINAADRTKNEKVSYMEWSEQGFITLTGGNSTDYDIIEDAIIEDSKKYEIETIGYDNYNSSHLVSNLQKEGIENMHHVAQTLKTLSPPTKEYERIIAEEELNHLENPVMRWMFSNITIFQDGNDRIKIDKAASSEKVDGHVATVMAIAEWLDWMLENKNQKSIYDQMAEDQEAEVETIIIGKQSIYNQMAEAKEQTTDGE